MEVKIETFDEFYKFIKDTDLTSKEISSLISQTLKVIVLDKNYPKEWWLSALREYWNTFKDSDESPIFFFIKLDVEE